MYASTIQKPTLSPTMTQHTLLQKSDQPATVGVANGSDTFLL